MLWFAVKLPARRFEFSVLQEDVEVSGMLSAPVAKTIPIAPTAIALTSIAITLVFTFRPCPARELDVFNRLVTGHCHLSIKSVKKSESYANRRKIGDW